jgi:SH3-like domain-containing protein
VRVPAGSKLRVTGRTQVADHQWFRVVLPDRRSGFVRDDVVTRDRRAIEDFTPAAPMAARRAGANVRSAPHIRAPLIVRLEAGSRLRITGRRQASGHTWFRVVVPDGRVGFVRDDVVEAAR